MIIISDYLRLWSKYPYDGAPLLITQFDDFLAGLRAQRSPLKQQHVNRVRINQQGTQMRVDTKTQPLLPFVVNISLTFSWLTNQNPATIVIRKKMTKITWQ